MTRNIILSMATSVLLMGGGNINSNVPKMQEISEDNGSFSYALKNGTFSLEAKLMYFNRDWTDDTKNDPTALTVGGIMKYETKAYMGIKAGVAYYTSHRVADIYSKEESLGSSMLDAKDGGSIDLLGEAYLDFAYANSSLRVGRQKMSIPNVTQRNIRLLPITHEAAVFKNSDIPDTTIELGYVKRYTNLGARANKFVINDASGKDGVSYIYITNKSLYNTTIKAEYIASNNDDNDANHKNSTWFEITHNLEGFGNKTFIKAHGGSSSYTQGDTGKYYGGKIGTTILGVDTEILFDKIVDNQLFFGFSPPPLYTDWYIGYDNYEASTGFGGALTFHPIDGLDLMVGAVDIKADEGNTDDDYLEINAVLDYKISDNSSFQFRYENRDQSDKSGKDDMQDIIVKYTYAF